MIVLEIGDRSTRLACDDAGAPPPVELPIGAVITAQAGFRHDRPTPGELEAAIENVENALMAGARGIGPAERVRGRGDALEAVARALHAGVQPDHPLPRARVEAAFQRLASAALGHPAAARDMPETREYAATLLILRELMHHLDFESIEFESQGRSAGGV